MKLKHVPNAISVVRIGMIGVLWVVALQERRLLFVILLAFTFLTDTVDGYLARKYRLESAFGAKLDTIADNLVAISVLGWVYVLRPQLYQQFGVLIGLLVLGFAASIALQFIRFGRRVPLHLYSNKLGGWVLPLFLLHAFLFEPSRPFAYVAAAVVG